MSARADAMQNAFSAVASRYSRYKSIYSRAVFEAILQHACRPQDQLDAVDIGAGTGVFSRMLARAGLRSVLAVEPNADMLAVGRRASRGLPIAWRQATGEETGLPSACADLVIWASSLHWVQLEQGIAESARLLRPGGLFVAVWSSRLPGDHALDHDLKELLRAAGDGGRRDPASLGRLQPATFARRLAACGELKQIGCLSAEETRRLSLPSYLGALRASVHLRYQLGDMLDRWADHTAATHAGERAVVVRQLTRAWVARRV